MRLRPIPLAAPMVLALVGCGTTVVDENMQALNRARPQGTAFTSELTEQYRQFASFEYEKMYDWEDADHFARKGLRSADGDVVQPEQLAGRSFSASDRAVLRDARSRLVSMLDGGGREQAPARAALAQAKFDCWVEQLEENHQPDHIAECRDAFQAALEEARQVVEGGGPEAVLAETLADDGERVYFALNSAKLTPEAKRALDGVAASVASKAVSGIVIEGHADRAGSSTYNIDLSRQRASAVREYLIAAGVSFVDIVERPYGESSPIVQTADGVPEPVNRRAVVHLRP